MNIVLSTPWTVERFLAWEDEQEGKHEFDGTQIIEMTGGSRNHQRIVLNLARFLDDALDLGRFEVIQEMRIAFSNKVRYPDISVVADPVPGFTKTLRAALVLFEVLSDETERTDREIKLAEYAAIPGIRHYVIVAQDRIALTVFARSGERWIDTPPPADALELPEIGVTLPISAIYRGVRFGGE